MVEFLKQPQREHKMDIRNISPSNMRVESIDIVRGLVMIVMALDHVRDFFHRDAFLDSPTNLATTTPVLFLTRWITHYCAPVFVFLSGISAYLAGQKKTKSELSTYLIKRGCWLILAELVIVSFGLSFDPAFSSFLLQVIWVIGWSMVALGLMVKAPTVVIVMVGLCIFLAHNMLDYLPAANENKSMAMDLFLRAQWSEYRIAGGKTIKVAYAILPWMSVMFLGYVCGKIFTANYSSAKRRKVLITIGAGMMVFFVLLRLLNSYGDPSPWQTQNNFLFTLFSFVNTTKYPPSLLYLCMTIGPALVVLGLIEGRTWFFGKLLLVYGKVPFFYYVLHFYLIHLLCVATFFINGGEHKEAFDTSAPLLIYGRPVHFGFDLWVVCLVWILVVAMLYYPCQWFGGYKKNHRQWWLSYV
jgi:uncharacterized membrane protein